MQETLSSSKLEVVVIFDLVDSTDILHQEGNEKAKAIFDKHNQICARNVSEKEGKVNKYLGDGILATFNDIKNACNCALSTIKELEDENINTKIALALGAPTSETRDDVFGNHVHLCARMEKFALPQQILISKSLYHFLHENNFDKNYRISDPYVIDVKGFGITKIYELTQNNKDLKNSFKRSLQSYGPAEYKRDTKAALIKNSKKEIIIIGTALPTLSGFFDLCDNTFSNIIKNKLVSGVKLKILFVNPEWALEKYKDSPEKLIYFSKTNDNILQIHKNAIKYGFYATKNFELLTFNEIPTYHCFSIDKDNEGTMFVKHYPNGLDRKECATVEFSKSSDPEMFDTYSESIDYFMNQSKPWKVPK